MIVIGILSRTRVLSRQTIPSVCFGSFEDFALCRLAADSFQDPCFICAPGSRLARLCRWSGHQSLLLEECSKVSCKTAAIGQKHWPTLLSDAQTSPKTWALGMHSIRGIGLRVQASRSRRVGFYFYSTMTFNLGSVL